MEQLIHIFGYLKNKLKLNLSFDPQHLKIIQTPSSKSERKSSDTKYRDANEQILVDAPLPRGISVSSTSCGDDSHAQYNKKIISHTGFLIFTNCNPVIWYRKLHHTLGTSTFSSELISLKTCMDHIVALVFKLIIFGITVLEETRVLCDNKSTVDSSYLL